MQSHAARALALVATVGMLILVPSPSKATFPNENGGRIAYVSDRDGNLDIFTMTPAGTQVTNLTRTPASDSGPRWSPDGSRIAFSSNRDGQREVSGTCRTRSPTWRSTTR